jgi:hypothetical protein
MRRHGETSQFAFSDKDNKWNRKERHCGETSTTNFFKWDSTHYNTKILQYQFLEKKNYVDRESVCFMDINFIYIHLFSMILFVFRSAPCLFKCTQSMGQIFAWFISRNKYYSHKNVTILLFQHILSILNTMPFQHLTTGIE